MAENSSRFERVKNLFQNWRGFSKSERAQYKVDTVGLLCRGLPPEDESSLKTGLRAGDTFFYASRGYVPFALFRLYKRGLLEESFSFAELKHCIRILIVMHIIDLLGFAVFKYYSDPVVYRHVTLPY